MKKILVFLAFASALTAASAQTGIIKSNIPDGADPAAIDIEFLPTDAVVLPGGDIQIGVAPRGKVKNIGTKPYMPGGSPLNIVIYQLKNGKFEVVKTTQVNVLQAGATSTIDFYTTYIKGKEQPPTFKLEVRSVNANVPNPDVNMNNNRREEKAN